MSSGFGPRSRSMFAGSDRPASDCTVSCVSCGVSSRPFPSEYWRLKDSPWFTRWLTLTVIDLNVESPIDCASLITLKRGSRRVVAFEVVLKTGRPSASVPVGLIGLMFVTTGRSEPFAYMKLTAALVLLFSARSSWALVCHVRATMKSESTAHGDCTARAPVPADAGKAGAPPALPAKV